MKKALWWPVGQSDPLHDRLLHADVVAARADTRSDRVDRALAVQVERARLALLFGAAPVLPHVRVDLLEALQGHRDRAAAVAAPDVALHGWEHVE